MAGKSEAQRLLRQLDELGERMKPRNTAIVRSKEEAERLAAEGVLAPFYALLPQRSATIEEWLARHKPSAEAAYGH